MNLNRILPFFFFALTGLNMFVLSSCMGQERLEVERSDLWEDYAKYKETAIRNRFSRHEEIISLMNKHIESDLVEPEVIGKSVKGREIRDLTLGKGKTKVLLWSQMHGDESTGTMAIFDILNFFDSDDEYNDLRKLLLEELEIHFVPMLNPDGAEAWRRRNLQDIDINRDVRQLNTPEARALKGLATRLKPQFGFNLHDQSTYYTAGATASPASISFLAPAYNYDKDMNRVRQNATKVIVGMNRMLQKHEPGKAGRYNDDYDPRCFGDNFQAAGISTILVECGGYPNDPEKQNIRKLNFYMLLGALESIAKGSYTRNDIDDYEKIPENRRGLYDVLIRNASLNRSGTGLRTHIAVSRASMFDSATREMDYRGSIEEIADLDRNFGYEEVDASNLEPAKGKIKEMTPSEWEKMTPEAEFELLKLGYLYVRYKDRQSQPGPLRKRLLNLSNGTIHEISIGQAANFVLNENGKARYAVINGYLVDLNKPMPVLPNTYGY